MRTPNSETGGAKPTLVENDEELCDLLMAYKLNDNLNLNIPLRRDIIRRVIALESHKPTSDATALAAKLRSVIDEAEARFGTGPWTFYLHNKLDPIIEAAPAASRKGD